MYRPRIAIVRMTLAAIAVATATSRACADLIVPAYNSLPNASAKIYLDFDGDTTPDFGTYHPGTTPAYDTDGDPNNFSQQELDNIKLIWMGVAEKYSPFKINVTTAAPTTPFNATTVVIGGDGAWAPLTPDGGRSGGVSIQGSFANPGFPNLAFVFPTQLANGNPRYVAEASAHEAGHGFNLSHQSLYVNNNFVQEYNPGNANRAPIMGKSYFATRGQWWLGPTPDSLANQDDLAVISTTGVTLANGFGYRNDDHPDYPTGAGDSLMVNPDLSIAGAGVIEHNTDTDLFSFLTAGGEAKIFADVAPFAPMLDLSLTLYDAGGNLITSAATPSLGESLDVPLAPGLYKLGVSSAGGYGDLGQYSISGFIPEPTAAAAAVPVILGAVLRRRRRFRSS